MENKNNDRHLWVIRKRELLNKFSEIIDLQDDTIKKFFNENLSNDNNTENILSTIQVGDIIWAKRYNNEQEKEKIPEGHQEGPFIILGILPEGFIGCPGTSTVPKEEVLDKCIQLDDDYLLPKQTYFKFFSNRFVSKDAFMYKIDVLNDHDKNRLFKSIKLKKCSHYEIENNIEQFYIPLEAGDIISNTNGIYLMIIDESEKFLCLQLNEYHPNKNFVDLNKLNFDNLVWIKNDKNNKFVNFVDNTRLMAILKKHKEYLENTNNQTNIQRGSLIIKNDKYYYIYGECSENWLMFEVFIKNNEEFDELTIKNQKFYTNYKSTMTIPKDSQDITPLLLAVPTEIDEIKNLKKSYKSRHKTENKKVVKKNSIKIGSIIKNCKFKNERFIIRSILDSLYECLSINDIRYGIYHPYTFEKKDTTYCQNRELFGIKWIENNPDFDLQDLNVVLEDIYNTQIHHNQQHIKRGSIFSINYKYYYVYSETSTSWLIREISRDYNIGYKDEKINHQNFYIDCNNIYQISKDASVPMDESDIECLVSVKKKN